MFDKEAGGAAGKKRRLLPRRQMSHECNREANGTSLSTVCSVADFPGGVAAALVSQRWTSRPPLSPPSLPSPPSLTGDHARLTLACQLLCTSQQNNKRRFTESTVGAQVDFASGCFYYSPPARELRGLLDVKAEEGHASEPITLSGRKVFE